LSRDPTTPSQRGCHPSKGTTHHQGLDVARHPGKAKPTGRKLRAKDRPLANDVVTVEEFDVLLDAWFGNIARVLLPGHGFYLGTGRNAFLMELDPPSCDVIVQRWEQFTGKTALRDRQPAQHTDGGAQRRPSRSRAG
jgi:hypothetical protein